MHNSFRSIEVFKKCVTIKTPNASGGKPSQPVEIDRIVCCDSGPNVNVDKFLFFLVTTTEVNIDMVLEL